MGVIVLAQKSGIAGDEYVVGRQQGHIRVLLSRHRCSKREIWLRVAGGANGWNSLARIGTVSRAVYVSTLVVLEIDAKLVTGSVVKSGGKLTFKEPGHPVDLEIAIFVHDINGAEEAETALVHCGIVAPTCAR